MVMQDTDKDAFVRSNGVIGLTGRGCDIVCMQQDNRAVFFWDNGCLR